MALLILMGLFGIYGILFGLLNEFLDWYANQDDQK